MLQTPPRLTRRALVGSGVASALAGAAQAQTLPWVLPPLRTAQVDGQSLAYFEQGSGPPLVLVHGMSGSPAFEWGRVIGPLSKRYRVIAPAQIGFGPSAQPDLPYDARTFVDSLGGLLRVLGVKRATLLGESFGGWVVAQYALAQAERGRAGPALPAIARLVIVDGAVGITPADGVNPGAQSLNDPAVGLLARAFLASQPKIDTTAIRARGMASVSRETVTPQRLAETRLPTLILWGEDDRLVPVSVARRLAAGIPGSRLALVRQCGHIPSVERPEDFLRHVTDFA